MHVFHISSIVIGMRPSLLVEGITVIFGNDLAGEKVLVDPRVVEKPRDDEKTERLAESSQVYSLPLWLNIQRRQRRKT